MTSRNALILIVSVSLGPALLGGCATPPAVSPLLRVAAAALEAEVTHLDADRQRDAARLEQTRSSLAAAFQADLHQRPSLDADWVADAAEVYAAAREALVRHDQALARERQRRADNLRAAATAIDRATALIERHDALIVDALGVDLWLWIRGLDPAVDPDEPAADLPR